MIELSRSDTHGGFHGDGLLVVHAKVSGPIDAETLVQRSHWKRAPLPETLRVQLMGGVDAGTGKHYGGLLVGPEALPFDPSAAGLYSFLNAQEKGERRYDAQAFADREHPSVNFAVVFLDPKTGDCWYFRLDT